MHGGRALLAAVLVLMLLISGAYANIAPNQGNNKKLIPSPVKPDLQAGPASALSNTSTEFLTYTNSSAFPTTVWETSQSQPAGLPPSNTTLTYLDQSVLKLITTPIYNGSTLFEPGEQINSSQTGSSSAPVPTHSDAWGWISSLRSLPESIAIPSGHWVFNVGLNVTSSAGTGTTGKLLVGVEAYSYNSSSNKFNELFGTENLTMSLATAAGGYHTVQLVVNAPRVNFSPSESLFIEYYLNASSFSPYNSFAVEFQVGGTNGGGYNFIFPDFGWVKGTVSPSTSQVRLGGNLIQVGPGGVFNVSVVPQYYTINVNQTGYENASETILVISGETTIVAINLTKQYSVDFIEKGLSPGTTWSVELNGTNKSAATTTLVFDVVNGTYDYTIWSVNGYKLQSTSSSSVVVGGSNSSITVNYSPVLYVVTFHETGINNGTKWGVDINGNASTSISSYLHLSLPNATYQYYMLKVPGFVLAGAEYGNITVNGSGFQVPIAFYEYTFALKVVETGLPTGTNWSAAVGGLSLSSKTSTITFEEPNGTYSVSVSGVVGYNQSVNPPLVSIFNGSRTVEVNFSQAFYNVVFRESGLSSGLNWSVTVDSTTHYSTGSTIVFYEPDGSYVYNVSQPSGFKMTSSDGILRVNGSGLSVSLNFTTASAPNGSGYNLFGFSSQIWMFIIIVGALIALEVTTSVMYYRKGRHGNEKRSRSRDEEEAPAGQTNAGNMTVTQMLMDRPSQGWQSDGNGRTLNGSGASDSAHSSVLQSPPGLSGITKQQYADMIEGGNSYAVFEPNASHSMELFEAGLTKGFKGLCFTRQYPEKFGQKFAFDGTAVFWLSNIGSENSIRPKDLEKITLQCNENLNKWKCIILIDGLEYLITNNGFLTVLKMIQFLRDATAVNKSILILSVNPNAIGENEVNLIMREVDKVLR